MGCIPSKHQVLEEDGRDRVAPVSKLQAWKTGRKHRKEFSRAKKARGPPSPVIEGEAAPWVKGHAVLTEKDGQLVVVRPGQ